MAVQNRGSTPVDSVGDTGAVVFAEDGRVSGRARRERAACGFGREKGIEEKELDYDEVGREIRGRYCAAPDFLFAHLSL